MTRIQLFAYEIDTHDQKRINAILRDRGLDPDTMSPEQYLHQQAGLQSQLIADHVVPLIEEDTLPVVMAPEFFFKWRDGMPYERVTFFNAIPHLEALSATFPAVLWVAGTFWWQEPQDAHTARIHNSALIFQGGRLLHSWQKMRLSGIDGLKDGPEIWDRHDPASARVLDLSQDPFFRAAVPGGGHLDCGIEVCLDHRTLRDPLRPGVLRTKYLEAHPDPAEGAGLDLHVMIAAGMPMQPENIVSRRGGVYLRCDGGAAAAPRSQSASIRRDGASAAEALRLWRPDCVETPVLRHVGPRHDNRLAIYAPVPVGAAG